MIFGRSAIQWVVAVFVAVCVFMLAKWLIPLLFGAISVAVPDQIVTIMALLIALGCVYGSWSWRAAP